MYWWLLEVPLNICIKFVNDLFDFHSLSFSNLDSFNFNSKPLTVLSRHNFVCEVFMTFCRSTLAAKTTLTNAVTLEITHGLFFLHFVFLLLTFLFGWRNFRAMQQENCQVCLYIISCHITGLSLNLLIIP